MSNEPTAQQPKPNFERLETVTGGYFPYILGHYHIPDVYVICVMDLNDQTSWSGNETQTIFHFLITPEEFAWRKSDPEKLNKLAQDLQTKMPKNRFYGATSRRKMTAEELKALCDSSVKEEKLESDGPEFEEFKKKVLAAAPRQLRVPATPFNQARNALANFQRGFNAKTATDEQKAEQDDLEKKLGWLIFKSEAIWVAYDECFNPRFPWLEPARGFAHIFSDEALANRSAAYYKENHLNYTTVKKLSQDEIKPFLRECETLGIEQILVDDGLQPVRVARRNIIPDLEVGFIERRNRAVRGMILRTLQLQRLLMTHGEEMEADYRLALDNWFKTWNRMMLQDIGNTCLFTVCELPAQMTEQAKKDYVYTADGMARINTLIKNAGNGTQLLARPGFKGRHLTINVNGILPMRMVKTPNNDKFWLLAFTSREEAMKFVQTSGRNDTVVAMSLDELAKATVLGLTDEQKADADRVSKTAAGILLDPTSVSLTLVDSIIDAAMKVRSEQRVIYRAPEKKSESEQPAATATPAADAPVSAQPAAVEDDDDDDDDDNSTVEIEIEVDPDEAEKPGFFGRFFGKK